MTETELETAVARAVLEVVAAQAVSVCWNPVVYRQKIARAALSIARPAIVEECAKVADKFLAVVNRTGIGDVYDTGYRNGATHIGNAIRALDPNAA